MVASIVLLLVLFAKKDQHPINMYLLAAWTMVEAYTIGVVCAVSWL
jgi:hypothetical protein